MLPFPTVVMSEQWCSACFLLLLWTNWISKNLNVYVSQSLPPLFTCPFPLCICRLAVNNHVVLLPIFFTDHVGCSSLLQIWQQMAPGHQHVRTVEHFVFVWLYVAQFCYNVSVLVKNYVINLPQSNFQSEQVCMSYWVTSGQDYY